MLDCMWLVWDDQQGSLMAATSCWGAHMSPLLSFCLCLQILGNNECFEPYTSNIYVRRVLSGEFTVVNQHLLMDLTALGLWSPDLKNELVAANGSVQVGQEAAVSLLGACGDAQGPPRLLSHVSVQVAWGHAARPHACQVA